MCAGGVFGAIETPEEGAAEDALARPAPGPSRREDRLLGLRELSPRSDQLLAIDAEDPGPAGFRGSLIVARFDSLEEARAWADADPYVEAGVYESVEVTPFKLVLP